MIRWIREKLADRRAKREAEERAKALAVRRKVLGAENLQTTPTGIFENVKRQVDEATASTRKAREAAQKILDKKK
jgi:hypothetical protein